MSRQSRGAVSRMSRRRIIITGVVLVVVAVFGLEFVSRVLFAPWSIGVLGRDTLTGEWVGTLQARQGNEFGLYLDLGYETRSSSYRGSSTPGPAGYLNGRAVLCAPTGERYEYELNGEANRSGRIKDLWVEYVDPALSGLNLRLTGQWDPPELRFDGARNPFLPDGTYVHAYPRSSDDPDDSFAPFTMTKGSPDDLEPICERIRQ